MNLHQQQAQLITRRHFFRRCNTGIGAIALASLMGRDAFGLPSGEPAAGGPPAELHPVANPLAAKAAHFAPKAKRVIYLHMSGSPPQHDLFDYKPKLIEMNGQPCPDSFLKGERFAFIQGHPKCLGTPHKFAPRGQSGQMISDLLPNISKHADDMTIVRSMTTDQFNHAPAELLLYTGNAIAGKASMGSWVTYGLGSENQDLPGFVVLVSGGTDPTGGKSLWSSGFLPSVYQGVQCRSSGEPILYVTDPKGMARDTRRRSLDALRGLNEVELATFGDPETLARINQYELAYRMQMAVPEVTDLSKESPETLAAYGAQPGSGSFANNCLLARRLVEKGVRFVQLFNGAYASAGRLNWDGHGELKSQYDVHGRIMDQPVAALIADLRQRGLLEETLVVWCTEFGRMPMFQKGARGRDHNPLGFTAFMTGAGVKRGVSYGTTDELGFQAVENVLSIHDLNATILHLLGLDHERLTFTHNGVARRLTDVHGHVIRDVLV